MTFQRRMTNMMTSRGKLEFDGRLGSSCRFLLGLRSAGDRQYGDDEFNNHTEMIETIHVPVDDKQSIVSV